jgi:hypothetical protein
MRQRDGVAHATACRRTHATDSVGVKTCDGDVGVSSLRRVGVACDSGYGVAHAIQRCRLAQYDSVSGVAHATACRRGSCDSDVGVARRLDMVIVSSRLAAPRAFQQARHTGRASSPDSAAWGGANERFYPSSAGGGYRTSIT